MARGCPIRRLLLVDTIEVTPRSGCHPSVQAFLLTDIANSTDTVSRSNRGCMLELLTGQREDDVQLSWARKELCKLCSSQKGPKAASVVTRLAMEARTAKMQRGSGMHGAGFQDHTLGIDYSDLRTLPGAMCSHLTCFHFKQGLPPSPGVVCQAWL